MSPTPVLTTIHRYRSTQPGDICRLLPTRFKSLILKSSRAFLCDCSRSMICIHSPLHVTMLTIAQLANYSIDKQDMFSLSTWAYQFNAKGHDERHMRKVRGISL